MRRWRSASLSAVLAALATFAAPPRTAAPARYSEPREPCANRDPLRQPFFGDTHVHTAYSFDAWGQGTLTGPRDAYRFARGEEIPVQPYDAAGQPGVRIRLRRPLDFAAVTDHSDLLGETQICQNPALEGYGSIVCRVVRRFPKLGYMLVNGHVYSSESPRRYSFCGPGGVHCLRAAHAPWTEIQVAAEEAYDRSAACRFTSFVGYEWTGMPGGRNIHRNVIFRNAIVQQAPTTYIETPTQEGLWEALGRECLDAGNGCDAIAIPHNSNVSAGHLFTITRPDGSPIDAADARTRARLETLVEVTQHKGDSECRPGRADELCAFEKLSYPRLMDMATANVDPAELPPRIYAREVLAEGLVQQQRTGVNPFKLGLIGSTDTHLSAPGMVDEDQHRGHAAGSVDTRFALPPIPDQLDFNPGGLAVLWAEENSRDALFDAMRRREAYGTTGPRITLRFFGGWDYPEDLCDRPDFVATGYARGVPMGGDLPPRPTAAGASAGVAGAAADARAAKAHAPSTAPRFAVMALRDASGGGAPSTSLQRLQIVKGWVEDGQGRERVYEVAGDPDSTADVDLQTCTPRGRGFDELCAVWQDPNFDPTAPAFYYARAVENPSCRWNTYACNAHGVDCASSDSVPRELRPCCDPTWPKTIQERAWSSPIWFTP